MYWSKHFNQIMSEVKTAQDKLRFEIVLEKVHAFSQPNLKVW